MRRLGFLFACACLVTLVQFDNAENGKRGSERALRSRQGRVIACEKASETSTRHSCNTRPNGAGAEQELSMDVRETDC
jgi:hypothetical protein